TALALRALSGCRAIADRNANCCSSRPDNFISAASPPQLLTTVAPDGEPRLELGFHFVQGRVSDHVRAGSLPRHPTSQDCARQRSLVSVGPHTGWVSRVAASKAHWRSPPVRLRPEHS